MKRLVLAFAAMALISAPAVVQADTKPKAAQCRDAKGKFIKCPAKAAPTPQKGPCRDAKGKFIKCPK